MVSKDVSLLIETIWKGKTKSSHEFSFSGIIVIQYWAIPGSLGPLILLLNWKLEALLGTYVNFAV